MVRSHLKVRNARQSPGSGSANVSPAMPSGSPDPSPRWHLWYLLSAPFAWNAASCSLSAKCPAFLSGAVSRNHTDDMGCKGEAGNCLLSLDRGLAHTRICWAWGDGRKVHLGSQPRLFEKPEGSCYGEVSICEMAPQQGPPKQRQARFRFPIHPKVCTHWRLNVILASFTASNSCRT